MTLTCDLCGRQADDSDEADAAEALAWTTSTEKGRLRRYCVSCSREHLRSMEGKLDAEHW